MVRDLFKQGSSFCVFVRQDLQDVSGLTGFNHVNLANLEIMLKTTFESTRQSFPQTFYLHRA